MKPSRDVSDFEEGETRLSAHARPKGPTGFALTVVAGPAQGTSLPLVPGATLLVGQSEACGFRLADPTVSRRHCSIATDGKVVRIRDLGSTNGTFVDGVSIVEAFVDDRQTLRLGDALLRVERVVSAAAPAPSPASRFGRFVGASEEIRQMYPLVERLARSRVPVVIEGETGTGKEVLAEAIHEASDRAREPFVVFDCTAVPHAMMEAELFGHEKGAFTGADATRKGYLEQAHGGTLFIDEIGDLDLALQPKLLRAIERAELRRIGGDRSIKVDVRFLAATRRNLDLEVQAGRFRDDLFHRLAVGRVEIPPLRARRGDVPLLMRTFWTDLGGDGAPPPELEARWADDPWPGNVRELRNAVARYLAVGDLQRASHTLVPAASGAASDPFAPFLALDVPLPMARLRVVEAFEQRYIEKVLAAHGGNVSRAAAASGIGRRYFHMLKAKMK